MLSDKQERDDSVASIYRKSLLYLVSNALETDLRTPILGLDAINDARVRRLGRLVGHRRSAGQRGAPPSKGASLTKRTTVVTSDRIRVAIEPSGDEVKQPSAHGGFDNDIDASSPGRCRESPERVRSRCRSMICGVIDATQPISRSAAGSARR